MNILITGSNGQLGSEIRELSTYYKSVSFIFKDLPDLNICKYDELDKFISMNKITTVINCAAYTAVDKAEEDEEIAREVNEVGVSNIVKALQKVNGKLIHISTDYVFNGSYFMPYKESDRVSPIGVYGHTKRAGELAVLNNDIDSIVIRTSWLYSSFGNNFVKTMLCLGSEKESIEVIFDQIGTPTYARDLAKTCMEILTGVNSKRISKNGNLYHYSNEGIASWYDFAISVMELGKKNCKVKPIQTSEYPTMAKRPYFSVLNKVNIKKDFNIEIPYWRDSLKECIEKIKS